jgi:DNA processing protein
VSTSDLLEAAAYLSRVAEPSSPALYGLVQRLGYLDAAAAVRAGAVDERVAAATEARRSSADGRADLDAAQRNGIRLLLPGDAEWPDFALASLYGRAARRMAAWEDGRRTRPERGELLAPLALWVKGPGSLSDLTVHSLAVVGSRAATAYGQHIAADISYALASREVAIVSGGAYGIDAAAHRGCLAADGSTVLVSAGGLDRPYPSGNAPLFDQVAHTGVLVSESPPGSAPHRQRFLSRNRLIAAFGAATLVVEAALRSGALNSARYARDLGRPVLAVPGPVTSTMSAGCHALIRRDESPAELVTGVEDVLPFCAGLAARSAIDHAGATGVDGRPVDGLDVVAMSVLDGFPASRSVSPVELSRLSGCPIAQVADALPLLQRSGLISATDGGRYRRVLPTAATGAAGS